jgi:hypothetical protein
MVAHEPPKNKTRIEDDIKEAVKSLEDINGITDYLAVNHINEKTIMILVLLKLLVLQFRQF